MPPSTEKTKKRKPVSLVIVDDHVFMRDLMARTLGFQSQRYAILAAVATAADAIKACRKLRPDVLILDINLPDKNGIDALPEIRRVAPTTRVLLCTGFPTDDRLSDLAGTGAHGFVEKTSTWDDFLRAVEQVSRGEYYFCSHNTGIVSQSKGDRNNKQRAHASSLTPRERQIITLIAQSLTSKEIALKLDISVATVETHRTNLMSKLCVRNAVGIASYAFRAGLTKPSTAHR